MLRNRFTPISFALLLLALVGVFVTFAPASIIQAIIPQAVPTPNKRGTSTIFALATSATPGAAGATVCDDGTGAFGTSGCGGSGPVTVSVAPIAGAPGSQALNALYKGVAGAGHIGSGDVDLYTVPSGRIGIIVGAQAYNDSALPVALYFEVKLAGTYYPVTAPITAIANASSGSTDIDIILQAGQTFSINAGTGSVLNPSASIWEADAASGLFSVVLTSFANGDNTLYTTPSGINGVSCLPAFVNIGPCNLYYVNNSGGTRTIHWNLVPSGGSVASTNLLTAANPIANTLIGNAQANFSLNGGDFLSINTNSAATTQIAWVNLTSPQLAPPVATTLLQSNNNSGGGMPNVVTFGSNVTMGNLLMSFAARNSVLPNPCSASDTLSSSWTQALYSQGSGGFPQQLSISWAFAAATGADTVTRCSASISSIVGEYSLPLGAGVDVTGGGPTLPTITLTQVNDLVVTFSSGGNCLGSVTPPEQMAQQFNDGTGGCDTMSWVIARGSGAFTSSLTGAGAPVYGSVAFKTH